MRIPSDVRKFAAVGQGVEAVLQRCGLDTYDLVLVDVDGNWTRAIFPSEGEAETAAGQLDVPLHRGWDDDRMTRRMNRRDHWNEPGGQKRAR